VNYSTTPKSVFGGKIPKHFFFPSKFFSIRSEILSASAQVESFVCLRFERCFFFQKYLWFLGMEHKQSKCAPEKKKVAVPAPIVQLKQDHTSNFLEVYFIALIGLSRKLLLPSWDHTNFVNTTKKMYSKLPLKDVTFFYSKNSRGYLISEEFSPVQQTSSLRMTTFLFKSSSASFKMLRYYC